MTDSSHWKKCPKFMCWESNHAANLPVAEKDELGLLRCECMSTPLGIIDENLNSVFLLNRISFLLLD